MTSSKTKERLDCFNDPNWMESALKRCMHFNIWKTYYSCFRCCNAHICKVLRDEMARQNKEQLEQILGEQTITINGKDVKFVHVTSSRDNSQYLNMYMGRSSRTSEWLTRLYELDTRG